MLQVSKIRCFEAAVTDSLKRIIAFAALMVFLCLPATALVNEYFGLPGVAVYFAAAAVILLIIFRFRGTLRNIARAGYPVLVGLFAVGLLAVFAIVYPMETSGKFSLGGDRDEMLNLSVRALFEGRYPYDELTPLGNEISVLPGSIFLAAPFVALGNAAFQNFFWVILLLVVTSLFLKGKASALIAVAAVLLLSPAVQYEYISGGDVLANSIFVLVFFYLAIRAFSNPGISVWLKIAAGIALGVALASRANFLLLLPLLFGVLYRKAGWKPALAAVLTAGVVAGAVTLPFYLRDPAMFPPIVNANKLVLYDARFPNASSIIILAAAALSVLLAVFLARKPEQDPEPAFYWTSAVVQLFPMLCGLVLDTIITGSVDFKIMHDRYGLMFLFFGLWGCWPYLFRKETSAEIKPPPMRHT